MGLTFKIIGDRELALYLGKVSKEIKPQAIKGLKEIANHLQSEVKSKFGTYQAGWPKLKRASVIAKYRRRSLRGGKTASYSAGADDPLLLFGNLRSSIKKEVNNGSLEAVVYSDNIYAAVHEYGYKQVPARSYMRLTLSEETDNVVDIMSRHIGNTI